jgi:hypothetical protein
MGMDLEKTMQLGFAVIAIAIVFCGLVLFWLGYWRGYS